MAKAKSKVAGGRGRANKTTVTTVRPADYVARLPDGPRKSDAVTLLTWFEAVTGLAPRMWGPTMIGFGRYTYRTDSGHAGEAMLTGFAPRTRELVVYVLPGFSDASMRARLTRLGRHRTGMSCLYIPRLADVDMDVLAEIVRAGVAEMRARHPTFDT